MKKIKILKYLVDFIWIITAPIGVPLILLCIPAIFFYDFTDLNIEIHGIELVVQDLYSKILIVVFLFNFLLVIYSLHLFRKSLTYFLKAKIFDTVVIHSFGKTGNLLLLSGVISVILSIISSLYFESKMTLEFGLNSHLTTIGLGLFFMVLSEVFQIAKTAKTENDLTI
ncbi:MAG: DUF2975 domain-containing protein [Polaribacter sp.]|nr:DUF2975 domain-containing protein [Polaribacter sp.]